MLVTGIRIRGRFVLFMGRKVARRTQPNNIPPVLLSVPKVVVGMEGVSRPAVITLSRLNHPTIVNRIPNRLSRFVLLGASTFSFIPTPYKPHFFGVASAPRVRLYVHTLFTVATTSVKWFVGLMTARARSHASIIEGFLFKAKPRSLLLTALISVYTVVGLSFIPAHHITYADPIIQPKLQPIAMLTMPVVASVQPAETLLYTLSDNLPNAYVWGQCTYGVASRIPIPSDWGNAGEWAFSASNQGFSVSNVPRVGAIAQTSGDSYLGHVGIVTAINDDGTITVWEENYYGLGVTDERITNTLEFPNFIYI